jgi:pimeloyl-ACP methyl ester carboxylesterase
VLKGWYVQPQKFNGNAVVLLHGITDNSEGVAGYSTIFLDQGYAVLLPDARAHGESGGAIATYGLKEADDLHQWVSWLYAHSLRSSQCVYGFGESYGAALLLQSLAVEPRFCAVAVEDSFSTAREMSYERVSGPLHLGPWFGKTLGQPIIDAAVLYSRMRYGIDLLKPSPLYGLQHSNVPVLLIQGAQDQSIRPKHAEMLDCAAFVRRTLNKFGYNGSCRGVAQPGSAPALGAGGRRFKSSRPDHFQPILSSARGFQLLWASRELANPAATSKSRQSLFASSMAERSFSRLPSLNLSAAKRKRSSPSALSCCRNGRLFPHSLSRTCTACGYCSCEKS